MSEPFLAEGGADGPRQFALSAADRAEADWAALSLEDRARAERNGSTKPSR